MRPILAACAAMSLAACGTTGGSLTPAQTLEQGDTAASLAYAATATALNTYEAAHPEGKAKAEAIKVQAWNLLLQERALYAAGQPIASVLSQLQTIEATAKGL